MASAAGPAGPADQGPPDDGTASTPHDPSPDAWLAAARADEAARVRSRRSSLVRQRAEEGTVLGVLADHAERRDLVALSVAADRRLTGWVEWVGADAIVVATTTGQLVAVPGRAVVAVSAVDRSLPPSPRPPVGAPDLHGLLVGLAGDGVRVAVRAGGTHESGDLAHVGLDVVTLRRDDRSVVHLALGAVDELTLLDDPWSDADAG